RERKNDVGDGKVAECTCGELDEAIGGSDPEGAVCVLGDAAGVAAGEGGGVFVVEDFEVDAVEAGDAVFGGDPDVAVARLEDLMDAVLRKPIFSRPGLMSEVVDALRGG